MVLNIYCWEKLTFSKLFGKVNLSESLKENLKKCTRFEEQKGARYIWGNVYFGIIIFSCPASTKPCPRFLLSCLVLEIKGFYQSSLGNEVDFMDIMNVSPNIFAKNENFKKMRQDFADERALLTRLISFWDWKTLVPFSCERKDLKTHV